MAATHKTLLILAYALLEWILILMLLLNSFFSFLIRKFATHYRLKPPCIWCSTIDHLLDPNNKINPYPDLICEAHATEIFNLYCCSDPLKPINELCRKGRSSCCLGDLTNSVDGSPGCASTFKSAFEENEMVQVMDPPLGNKSGHLQVFDQIIPLEWTDSSTSCSTSSSINGHESMFVNEDEEGRFMQSIGCQDEEDNVVTMVSLMEELKAERLAVCGLYIELDEERKGSATAANHAMAMITRLQEEKVALQMESVQNQRMMDEQAEYDQEVLQLLNELIMKLEKEKCELENEVEMYKEKLLDFEENEEGCLDESDVMDLRTLKETIVGFEVERLWILDELEELDQTLMMVTNDIDGEGGSYKGNRVHLFHVDEGDEASHSAWSQTSF